MRDGGTSLAALALSGAWLMAGTGAAEAATETQSWIWTCDAPLVYDGAPNATCTRDTITLTIFDADTGNFRDDYDLTYVLNDVEVVTVQVAGGSAFGYSEPVSDTESYFVYLASRFSRSELYPEIREISVGFEDTFGFAIDPFRAYLGYNDEPGYVCPFAVLGPTCDDSNVAEFWSAQEFTPIDASGRRNGPTSYYRGTWTRADLFVAPVPLPASALLLLGGLGALGAVRRRS